METGRYTALELTRLYLKEIESVDRSGPILRSIIELNPDAEEIARELDDERRDRGARGPLHGIPVVLKDNIATKDRMMTTAGSLALEGVTARRDAFLVDRLRAAGAVILGKANLSEWANFRSRHSSSGWSARGGQCRNPYVLDRNPCGSSSGSAVAVSASLCAAAVGTETNGSIACPSNVNGIVGVKPTVGLISRSGIIPISKTQDTAGPMCRTIRDAALLLSALVGVDPSDPATEAAGGHLSSDYTQFLDPDGLKGARIGVLRQFFGFHRDVDALMEQGLGELRRLGAELVDEPDLRLPQGMGGPSYQVLLYEFAQGVRDYLVEWAPDAEVRTLEDLIAFNERHQESEMPYFGQDIFLEALELEKDPQGSTEYQKALELSRRLSREEGIDRLMAHYHLDALVGPSGGPAWLTDLVNGDNSSGGSGGAAAIAGYPHITVPMGSIRGLPVGLSFLGRAWSEPELFRFAYAFEQATRARSAPAFLPTLELA